MKRFLSALKVLLLVSIGAVLAVSLGQCGKASFPSQWIKIEEPKPRAAAYDGGRETWGGMCSWSAKVMEKAESSKSALPQIKELTGRVKFVTSGQRGNDYATPLGYEVELLLYSVEEEKEMIKAAKDQGVKSSWDAEVFPRDIKVQIDFVLRDKDGFHLATLKGQQDWYDSLGFVELGKPALLKGMTSEKVTAADANATKTVECIVSFEDMRIDANEFLNVP
jgi:hypothetical protein